MPLYNIVGNLNTQIWEIIGLFGTRDEKALGEIGVKWETCVCSGRDQKSLNGVWICFYQLTDAFANDDLC